MRATLNRLAGCMFPNPGLRQQQALCSNMLNRNMFSSNAEHVPEVSETSHDIIRKIYQYQPNIVNKNPTCRKQDKLI